MLLIFIMYALFGTSFPISKMLLKQTTPIFFTAVRMIIAGIFLLLYQFCYDRKSFNFHPRHFMMYGKIIFFGVYLTYILRFWGLSQLSAAKTADRKKCQVIGSPIKSQP